MQPKTTSVPSVESDSDYAVFERLIAEHVAAARGPLFSTNAAGLFEAYLAGIPEQFRQHYNCRCCRRFIERYGGLVTVDDCGDTLPLFWGHGPDFFSTSVDVMFRTVSHAKVTGIFLSGDKVWGTPFNVPRPPSKFQGMRWTHLHGTPPIVFTSPIKTAEQAMAEKLQDYITLKRGIEEFPIEAVVQAVRVLEADAVGRSEKTLGVAQWLLVVHREIADARGSRRDNLIWLAVAKAPPGWCHIRSTMIATLLDDVVQGLPFESIKRRWNEKMHPLQYQRPTAPPKEGNIEQANKIVAKLQSEGALQRRFARLSEVTALWTPQALEPAQDKLKGGAFDHLKPKSAIKEVELPPAEMVWEKFASTVLPTAAEIEVKLPSRGSFFGFVTAVNADAPPILQWDGLDGLSRNPVSWYFYHGGSSPERWGLVAGAWEKVSAICLKPCHWQKPDSFKQHGNGVFFVLPAAKDSQDAKGSFFPECLRAEYHGIRSVMEAYAQQAVLTGREEGNANGIALNAFRDRDPLLVRVRSREGVASYGVSLK